MALLYTQVPGTLRGHGMTVFHFDQFSRKHEELISFFDITVLNPFYKEVRIYPENNCMKKVSNFVIY